MERRNERIEALLERYFEAQTSAAEERELREFFSGGDDIPRELRYARTMFGGLGALAEEKTASDGLEKADFTGTNIGYIQPGGRICGWCVLAGCVSSG